VGMNGYEFKAGLAVVSWQYATCAIEKKKKYLMGVFIYWYWYGPF
jgi:hypothetical protein